MTGSVDVLLQADSTDEASFFLYNKQVTGYLLYDTDNDNSNYIFFNTTVC